MSSRDLALIERPEPLPRDPQWYKDAIIYEVRVRSFYDSNGDGIGDFRGLASKLDYLQDLGVTAVWLLPFYASPLRDDGYDIAEYTDVHPDVGTLADFDHFLAEAHRRGLRVITELVLNHTSDQHPWFQRARRAPPGSREREFYVWSETPDRYKDARIIFKDFEPSNWSWDPVARAYFWHRFYAHQPDLNFENPEVEEALFAVVDFWLGRGVDGLRLDAVPYLFEEEGTSCENLPRTHELIKRLRRHIDERFADRMLLAEANQWPEDAAAYFGEGDECHMNFHFPIMPRMFMAMQMEDRFPLLDILAQTPQLHPTCQWALFLRNHDELTLEMVTDEERDYMYRAYAAEPAMRINLGIRRRLAPLCGNDRRKMELLTALLMSFPGTPVLYYGDEIGMGDNVFLGDRNGVRTPMQWSSDRNAGFSRANPQRLILPVIIDPEYHYEALNVEAQQNTPASLLWWTKRLIALRKSSRAFGRGTIEFLTPENYRVLAFVREHEGQIVLVVANLSRFAQYVELDLSRWRGLRPRELLGQTEFPAIGQAPYFLSLGGHGFFWFALERPSAAEDDARAAAYQPPVIACADVAALLAGEDRPLLERILPRFLPTRRWAVRKYRRIVGVEVIESFALTGVTVLILRATYTEGDPDTFLFPVTAVAPDAGPVADNAVLARARTPAGDLLLVDACEHPAAARTLLAAVMTGGEVAGARGQLRAQHLGSALVTPLDPPPEAEPRRIGMEYANAVVQYGDRYVLKLFRRVDDGRSPELELSAFLDRQAPGLTPEVVGALEYQRDRREPQTLAVLSRFVANEGTAWTQARDELRRYFERVLTQARDRSPPPLPTEALVETIDLTPPPDVAELVGPYLDVAAHLGRRTAELHMALSAVDTDPTFAPEPYSTFDHRARYQALRNLVGRTLRLVRTHLADIPADAQDDARVLLDSEGRVLRFFDAFLRERLRNIRIRVHGDYHLGQLLFTGRDYVIIDLEGDRHRNVSDRKRKRTALRDVAGMVRSFHAGVFFVLRDPQVVRPEDRATLRPWAEHWQTWVSAAFLRAYLQMTRDTAIVPPDRRALGLLLESLIVERAFMDLRNDLERGEGIAIPLHALVHTLRLG